MDRTAAGRLHSVRLCALEDMVGRPGLAAQRIDPDGRHRLRVIHPDDRIAPLALAKIQRENEQHIQGDRKEQTHQGRAGKTRPAAQKFPQGVGRAHGPSLLA